MTGVTGVSGAASPTPMDTASTDQSQLASAFSRGLVNFMGVELQSAESDTVSAIEDNTSDPDAPA